MLKLLLALLTGLMAGACLLCALAVLGLFVGDADENTEKRASRVKMMAPQAPEPKQNPIQEEPVVLDDQAYAPAEVLAPDLVPPTPALSALQQPTMQIETRAVDVSAVALQPVALQVDVAITAPVERVTDNSVSTSVPVNAESGQQVLGQMGWITDPRQKPFALPRGVRAGTYTADMRLFFDSDGYVTEVEVLRASPRLMDAVREHMHGLQYQPTLADGRNISGRWYTYTMTLEVQR